ncbi:hypothetical protein FGO68_gene14128 [Halteria grandinella]|uniref:Uncharacterized protein n=1 Tax=Halteria grandinella TaxID=5974 RepID=A0A8J8T6V3_HALGN|nr:hypothetical protein FGO68_gene14128 [Halteria grandinella]
MERYQDIQFINIHQEAFQRSQFQMASLTTSIQSTNLESNQMKEDKHELFTGVQSIEALMAEDTETIKGILLFITRATFCIMMIEGTQHYMESMPGPVWQRMIYAAICLVVQSFVRWRINLGSTFYIENASSIITSCAIWAMNEVTIFLHPKSFGVSPLQVAIILRYLESLDSLECRNISIQSWARLQRRRTYSRKFSGFITFSGISGSMVNIDFVSHLIYQGVFHQNFSE